MGHCSLPSWKTRNCVLYFKRKTGNLRRGRICGIAECIKALCVPYSVFLQGYLVVPRLRYSLGYAFFHVEGSKKMKRRNRISYLRAIQVMRVIVLSAVTALGENINVSDFSYSYSLSTKEATLTGYSGSSSHITIPTSFTVAETYKDNDGETHTRHHTITVTSIGSWVFANKTFITSVSFHNKLKSIGSSAIRRSRAARPWSPPRSTARD